MAGIVAQLIDKAKPSIAYSGTWRNRNDSQPGVGRPLPTRSVQWKVKVKSLCTTPWRCVREWRY